jgi:TRAP-type C4-dicarboxylate transport system permease small subunit
VSAPQESGRLRRAVTRVLVFIEEDVSAILLAVAVMVLCADVVGRYVFHHPIPGAPSIAMVCFVWLTYLGAAAAARRGRAITIDVLVGRFAPRWQAVCEIIVQLVVAGVVGFCLYWTCVAVLTNRFVELPGLGVSRRVLTMALLVGFGLMTLYCLRDLLGAVRGAITGKFDPIHEAVEDDDVITPRDEHPQPPALPVTTNVFIKRTRRADRVSHGKNGERS